MRLGAAWEDALTSDRPVILEVKTDPGAAPLPPYVTFEQAKAFLSSMAKDSRAGHVIRETARQSISGLLPAGRT